MASPRYTDEILAWEYDQRNQNLAPGEIDWYLKYASQTGGPLLELACGSGRLLLPLARAGYEIDGVDNAAAMLARLQAKVAMLKPTVRQRVRTFCADMVDFEPHRQYALVLIGYNSLSYLMTQERIALCLRRVHQWLKEDGLLLFMVQRIDPTLYHSAPKVVDWLAQPLVDAEHGMAVGSKFVTYLEPGGERLVKERTYHVTEPTGVLRVIQSVTYTPILTLADYLALVEAAGFVTQVFTGYTEQIANDAVPLLCFVCQKENPVGDR